MTRHSHQTVPTQRVDAAGVRFAYRRFGKSGGVPLVFNQHYIGTMDYWDPAVTDGLARDCEVILFNNTGVSSSSGEVPTTFEEMGANAVAFIKALGLTQVDVFGISIGGFVASDQRCRSFANTLPSAVPRPARARSVISVPSLSRQSLHTPSPHGEQAE
ncbi:MAG: hypothetical protein QOD93_5371 [Acetobacteraceae bacterium]|jgi:hypothetical protein|nr:hypothetical protein [Acetobacteraceae bacterium]